MLPFTSVVPIHRRADRQTTPRDRAARLPLSDSRAHFALASHRVVMAATNASATRGLVTTARHTRRHRHHNHHHRARGASGRAPRASTDASAAPSSSPSSSPGAVFETGSTDRDAFDASRVSSPVVKAFRGDEATRWLMWYTATSSRGEDSIGLATSSDGLHWTRSDGDTETYRNDVESKGTDVGRVLTRNDEDWWCFDTRGVVVGDVQLISSDSISGGSVYWMFYHGYDHSSGSESANDDDEWTATTRPGLCLSQDGRNWARVEGEHHTGALFDVGEPNEWDASGVRDPKVLLAGPNDIRVYYGSVDAETGRSSVGVATTRDGFVYAKRGARGVFGPGPSGSFDDAGVASPCVVRLGKKEFIMFYEAYSSANPGVASIALATSEDGFVWTRPNAPVLTAGEPGSWDQGGVGRPYAVPMAGDRVRLYYEGRARAGDARGVGVGVAVSAEHDRFAFVRRRARVTDDKNEEKDE